MTDIERSWTDELSREYVRFMERNVARDHRRFAKQIVSDWPDIPAGATVVDVAGGPAFLLLEVAPKLQSPRLIVTDITPAMTALGRERARKLGFEIEAEVCPAEKLSLPNNLADLILCKHFLRLSSHADEALREMARVLKPGGRAYFIDFNAERPWLGAHLLHLWMLLTAPPFFRRTFGATMKLGWPASKVPERLLAAGFCKAEIMRSRVSYLVRATK